MTNKEHLLALFKKHTIEMAEYYVHSDDWGYYYHDEDGDSVACDTEEEAILNEIIWLESKYIKPKPIPPRDMTISIPIPMKDYIAKMEGKAHD